MSYYRWLTTACLAHKDASLTPFHGRTYTVSKLSTVACSIKVSPSLFDIGVLLHRASRCFLVFLPLQSTQRQQYGCGRLDGRI